MRLFDGMVDAQVEAPVREANDALATELAFRFEEPSEAGALPDGLWFARPNGRSFDWTLAAAVLDPAGGLEGSGALRIGPGVERDYSRAVMLVPVSGRCEVVTRARVRVTGHPSEEPTSYREALRVYQYRGAAVEEPTGGRDVLGERARRAMLDRAVRRVDPSGWAPVVSEVVTASDAATLEIHLLHRSGDAATTTTWFDDVTVEIRPLSEAAYLERIVRRYRPRDGQESQTPWRLRVDLRTEVRDCVAIPVDGQLSLSVPVPGAEHAPQLRFGVGALPESAREKGDGARMSVVFSDEGGEALIGAVDLDPKNERDDRSWRDVTFDLAPVAGRTGSLMFRVTDVDDQPDELDSLLLATPRIEPQSTPPAAPNILLIGVDTLRADRMSAFGYERDTTPNLKALADEGVRFSMARSPAPWTLPSFSSMLTSLYPSAHGAGRGGHDEWEAIDPTTVSIAEVLARNGYETAGIVANGLISPRYGLDQGFDAYTAAWAMESVEQDAPRVARWIEGHTRTPWLMFWHIMDPHLPYMTSAEEREAFTDSAYEGQFSKESRRGGPAVPFEVLDPRPGRRWFAHEGPPPLPELTEPDVAFVSDYYDAEIHEVDAGIGRVLQTLRDSGQWERTIVAFVADHGEGLGDHGHYHHGYTLFDDQVHVPMIVRIPGTAAPRSIERPVSTVDLMPTLLGLLGIPAPDDAQGVDRLAADAPDVDATFIEYPTYDSSAQKAWVEGRFKYLWDPLYHTEALFDFVADPAETRDVRAEHPGVVARAREALSAFRVEHLAAGRFHIRLRGEKGQRLRLRIATSDLFDANFVTRPAVPEEDFEMDLDRSYLLLDTVLDDGRLELRFWCRGDRLSFEATLDGESLTTLATTDDGARLALPGSLSRGDIPVASAESFGWPDVGSARLWLEEGASEPLPVVNTPEEADRLRELGYGH